MGIKKDKLLIQSIKVNKMWITKNYGNGHLVTFWINILDTKENRKAIFKLRNHDLIK